MIKSSCKSPVFFKQTTRNRFTFILIMLCFWQLSYAQDYVRRTFKDTRIINTQSVETLQQRKLDFRVVHRFGDLKRGWTTLYGLESSQDISIGVDYGVTNDLTIGLHRTKGAGPLSQLVNTFAKYRILKQAEGGSPISLAALGIWTSSTQQRDEENSTVLNGFSKFTHRFVYGSQLLIARKFSDKFSLQITPSLIHRNVVAIGQNNQTFSMGGAFRFQLTKVMGLIVDASVPIGDTQAETALGVGLEIDTGGHVFQINFTNAKAIFETDYIPNNRDTWGNGEVGLGFTISRIFNL
ncbi:MAG: DUF5777 family beta-barrel protein [Bacteroidota bacterium]